MSDLIAMGFDFTNGVFVPARVGDRLVDAAGNPLTTTGLRITTTTLPAATNGTPYSSTVTATGGKTPYAWSISAGSLPTGLSINSSTGEISGTPTTNGTFNFTVRVTDDNGLTDDQALSIVVSGGVSNVGSLVMDGANDYVDIFSGGLAPFTAEIWFNEAFGITATKFLLFGPNNWALQITGVAASRQLSVTGPATSANFQAVSQGTWHKIGLRTDAAGTTYDIIFNGTTVYSHTPSTSPQIPYLPASNLHVGDSAFFQGRMDNIWYFNINTRSIANINTDLNKETPTTDTAAERGHWKCDEVGLETVSVSPLTLVNTFTGGGAITAQYVNGSGDSRDEANKPTLT